MNNQEIRSEMRRKKVKQWELAEQMKVSESTFCRWMRKELPCMKKQAVLKAVAEVVKEKERGDVDG